MGLIVHVLFALAVAGLAAGQGRGLWAKSRWLGAVFALGLAVRLVSSLTLFTISFFDLNILKSMHFGGGYWTLAIDSQLYYELAAKAARGALADAAWQPMSPSYVTALAVWMRVAGISILSAILLNCACYMATAAVITAGYRQSRDGEAPGAVVWVLAAFSFSPMLLLSSTQVLKDPFMLMFIAIGARGTFQFIAQAGGATTLRALAGSIFVTALAATLIAGVRWYYATFVWVSVAAGVVALVLAVRARSAITRTRVLWRGATGLFVVGVACLIGSGSYLVTYRAQVSSSGVTGAIDATRESFVGTGGATNLVKPPASAPAPSDVPELVRLMGMPVSHKFDMGSLKAFIIAGSGRTPVAGRDLAGAVESIFAPLRIAYFLPGWDPRHSDGPRSAAPRTVASALEAHRVAVTPLPAAMPASVDGTLLIVVGNARALSPSELAATRDYLARGGRVFRVIDVQDSGPPPERFPRLRRSAALVGTGLAAMFVPMSILEAASFVDIGGSRGMLLVADIDTLFLDASLVGLGWLLWRRRGYTSAEVAGLISAMALAGVCAVLLAYVVTNFGTLLRLRLLVAAPIWLAPLALRQALTRGIGEGASHSSLDQDVVSNPHP